MHELRQHLEHYRHVIWDWNGTLLADIEQIWHATIAILDKYCLPHITVEQYRQEFCFPLEHYYEKLGFDFAKVSCRQIAHDFQHEYTKRYRHARVFDGTPELLAELQAKGKTHSVLSASHQSILEESLEHFSLTPYFSHIVGVANRLARGKAERGKALLERTGMAREETIIIGDTDHDLEVGRELGIDVLLIADGHQSYERLRPLHQHVLVSRYAPRRPGCEPSSPLTATP